MIDSNKLVKHEKPLIFSDNITQTTKTQSVEHLKCGPHHDVIDCIWTLEFLIVILWLFFIIYFWPSVSDV